MIMSRVIVASLTKMFTQCRSVGFRKYIGLPCLFITLFRDNKSLVIWPLNVAGNGFLLEWSQKLLYINNRNLFTYVYNYIS